MNIDENLIKDGIRFECQGSGKCCVSHDEYGYVYLNQKDRKRLAMHLNLSVEEFIDLYCTSTDGFLHLKNSRRCQFLDGKKCSVYSSRPEQCRTWPFWPETLNAKAWNEEVASFCPGIGKGRLFSAAQIKRLAQKTDDHTTFER